MDILKEYAKLYLADKSWKKIFLNMKQETKAKAILIGTPVHGNLGDHAIAEEEKQFLKDYFPDYSIYEVIMPLYHVFKKRLKKFIGKNDIIFISGGGWMGNLWIHNEIVIREIIQTYLQNLIIIFPQTVFYTEDKQGIKECSITSEIVGRHKNIHLFLREQKSLDYVNEHYIFTGNSDAALFPDMALYGSRVHKNSLKVGNMINVCLREDCEAEIDEKDELLEEIGKIGTVKKVTTVVPYRVSLKNRNRELEKSWKQFAEAKVTVTDRLHAMLFSVLNGTPCVAINNRTGKVWGVLSWIEKSGMVFCASSKDEVIEQTSRAMNVAKQVYNRNVLEKEFEVMGKKIRKGIEQNEYKKTIGD